MLKIPNPLRFALGSIGLVLARLGVVDPDRVNEITDLSWPRILGGIANTSKGAVDVAMVGIAVGTTGVAGLGFAGPFWGVASALSRGLAGGTISLVSQRFGADAHDELGRVVRVSIVLVLVVTLPLAALFWLYSPELVSLLTDNDRAIEYGGTYLRVLGLGIPFAGLNVVGNRTLVGCDDAFRPMQLGAVGAVANGLLNATFIFGLGLGVAGAALGTVLTHVVVTVAYVFGLLRGQLPLVGAFPVRVSPFGSYTHRGTVMDLVEIGVPVALRNLVWSVAAFPMFAILAIFGEATVAAYVIARRITRVMNAPGWGFGLAATSLVGQALGRNDDSEAAAYGRDVVRFAVATYTVSAALVAIFAGEVVILFSGDPTSPEIPIATNLVYASCIAVVCYGLAGVTAAVLDASGDTRIPFLSQFLGTFVVSIPLAYLGATTSLGLWGLYLAFVAQTAVPALVNFWHFRTGKWKEVSEQYRPDVAAADD